MELRRIATQAGVNEVSIMGLASSELLDFLEFLVISHALSVGLLNQVSLSPVENNPDLVALRRAEQTIDFFVRRVLDTQSTRLENDAFISVVVDRHARICRIARIDVAVILAFGLIADAVDDNAFSDVPEFPGVLKPAAVRWPAPVALDGFLDAVDQVRDEVDSLVGSP